MNIDQVREALPPLPNECTVEDVFRWAEAVARRLGPVPEMAEDARRLLDMLWDGPEPRPPLDVVAVIAFLPEVVGMPDREADAWLQVTLSMCSLPAALRQMVRLDLKNTMIRLDDRAKTVVKQ